MILVWGVITKYFVLRQRRDEAMPRPYRENIHICQQHAPNQNHFANKTKNLTTNLIRYIYKTIVLTFFYVQKTRHR